MHFLLNYGNILLAVDTTAYAPVAQLDRVSDYESEGRGFESLPARQTKIIRTLLRLETGSDLSIISNILTLTAKSINTLFMKFESRQRAAAHKIL